MAYTHILSLSLLTLGITGLITLLSLTAVVIHAYQGSSPGSFRWHLRNDRLKRLCALACLFFLAMAASYAVLQEVWAILYLIIALKTGTWWLRFSFDQRI
ncbi:MAG: hypothetical protein J2P37_18020 [Ktedonobacteraceae bacterium]|nr:hypothetical protein [Ktedonobacteraceae bacterium]